MARIALTIPMKPTGQMRPKAAGRLINGRPVAMVYKAAKQKTREGQIAAFVTDAMMKNNWEKRANALGLKLTAFMPIPKSFSKKKREEIKKALVFPEVKPDLSNILKQIEDVCQDVLFDDDKRICQVFCQKFYGDPSRIEVELWDLL